MSVTEEALDLLLANRDRLLGKLAAQRTFAAEMWQWYTGQQEPPVVQRNYREAYRLLLGLSRTPWARLVVDTVTERLQVQGFRSGTGSDEQSDAAWSMLQASMIDADQRLVYTEALVVGVGYVSVRPDDESELAQLAVESSFETTHETVPGQRRRVSSALKLFPLGNDGRLWAAELYRPEASYRWLLELTKAPPGDRFPIDQAAKLGTLDWIEDTPFEQPNPLGVVPLVPFENRLTVLGGGLSEIADVVPILQRIDKLVLDAMLTSEYGSFRQRWATGLEVPRDPETNEPTEPFKAAVSRLWVSDDPDTRFGSFEASDVGQYLKAIDAQVAALAAITRVPAHYLLSQNLANPPSAESLVAAESGLVAKVRDRQRQFGEAWEAVVRLGFGFGGADDWAADMAAEVDWIDAEMRNPAQVADAALKLSQIGVPIEALWAWIGASPQQVDEWRVLAAQQALFAPSSNGASA